MAGRPERIPPHGAKKMKTIEPGIYTPEQIDNALYHGGPGWGSSQLKMIYERTPAHLKHSPPKEGVALDVGTGIHTAVLEPHNFDKEIARGPSDRRGNKWKEALEEHSGKIVLTEGDYDMCLHIRDAVYAQSHIARILQSNSKMVEHSAYAEVGDLLLRVRPDFYDPAANLMLDVKSTKIASASEFTKSVFNYSYHLQAAMYPEIWHYAGGGETHEFLFLAIEKEPPYLCALYRLDEEAQEQGLRAYRWARARLAWCVRNDEWPGYTEEITDLSMPRWADRIPYEEQDG